MTTTFYLILMTTAFAHLNSLWEVFLRQHVLFNTCTIVHTLEYQCFFSLNHILELFFHPFSVWALFTFFYKLIKAIRICSTFPLSYMIIKKFDPISTKKFKYFCTLVISIVIYFTLLLSPLISERHCNTMAQCISISYYWFNFL